MGLPATGLPTTQVVSQQTMPLGMPTTAYAQQQVGLPGAATGLPTTQVISQQTSPLGMPTQVMPGVPQVLPQTTGVPSTQVISQQTMPLGTGAAYDVGAMGALGTTGYDTLGTGVDLNAYGGQVAGIGATTGIENYGGAVYDTTGLGGVQTGYDLGGATTYGNTVTTTTTTQAYNVGGATSYGARYY